MSIWVVSYLDDGDSEATVTAFDNQGAAEKCFTHFKTIHKRVALDEVPLYTSFEVF